MTYAVCGAVGPCPKRGAREESPVRRGGPMCGFRIVKCELSLSCPGGAAKSTAAYGGLVWRRLSGPGSEELTPAVGKLPLALASLWMAYPS